MKTTDLIAELKKRDPKGRYEVCSDTLGIMLLGPIQKDESQEVMGVIQVDGW